LKNCLHGRRFEPTTVDISTQSGANDATPLII